MPKISFRKEYNKPPIVVFKYDNSKSYYVRFYVDKKYKSNGCEEQSLGRHIKTLREAEQKAKEIWREFFKNYSTNDFVYDIDFHKDIAKPYLDRLKKNYDADNKPQYFRKVNNRYDNFNKSFYVKAQNSFLNIAKNRNNSYILDSSKDDMNLEKKIFEIVNKYLKFK